MRHSVLVCILLMFSVSCSGAGDAGESNQFGLIKPCREMSRTPPVSKECAAAAIAEEAFLRHTEYRVPLYTIRTFEHSAAEWRFIVEWGDAGHPPPRTGLFWWISVDRTTGKVALEDGR